MKVDETRSAAESSTGATSGAQMAVGEKQERPAGFTLTRYIARCPVPTCEMSKPGKDRPKAKRHQDRAAAKRESADHIKTTHGDLIAEQVKVLRRREVVSEDIIE